MRLFNFLISMLAQGRPGPSRECSVLPSLISFTMYMNVVGNFDSMRWKQSQSFCRPFIIGLLTALERADDHLRCLLTYGSSVIWSTTLESGVLWYIDNWKCYCCIGCFLHFRLLNMTPLRSGTEVCSVINITPEIKDREAFWVMSYY